MDVLELVQEVLMCCDVSDLIQVPFKWGGRDKAGMDCQGLFLEVMSRFGNKIVDLVPKDYSSRHYSKLILQQILSGKWLRQEVPEP